MVLAINDPHLLIHLWLFCDGGILIISLLSGVKITSVWLTLVTNDMEKVGIKRLNSFIYHFQDKEVAF